MGGLVKVVFLYNCFSLLIVFAWLQEVTWTAQSPSYKQKLEKVVIANVAVDERVEPHSSKTFSQDIKIPPVPPSNLQNCKIIDLEYVFKVKLLQ